MSDRDTVREMLRRKAEMALREIERKNELEHKRKLAEIRAPQNIPTSAPSQPQSTPKPLSRREFVIPLLEAKGWSILDWANEANVSHATALDYLASKTKAYRSTRVKLAKAL